VRAWLAGQQVFKTYQILHGIPNALTDLLSSNKDGGLLILDELRLSGGESSLSSSIFGFSIKL